MATTTKLVLSTARLVQSSEVPPAARLTPADMDRLLRWAQEGRDAWLKDGLGEKGK